MTKVGTFTGRSSTKTIGKYWKSYGASPYKNRHPKQTVANCDRNIRTCQVCIGTLSALSKAPLQNKELRAWLSTSTAVLSIPS